MPLDLILLLQDELEAMDDTELIELGLDVPIMAEIPQTTIAAGLSPGFSPASIPITLGM
jgi:hypothetical protein